MCQLVHIEFAGRSWVFENTYHESNEEFYDRCWFIVHNHDKNESSIKYYADLYINKKYLGVTYPDAIENALNTFRTCS